MGRVSLAGIALLAALLGPPSAAASTVILFRTPSGNIGCEFSAGLPGAETPAIRCDIRSRLQPAPPPPKGCRLDSGDSLQISPTGGATLVCHGDTAIDPTAPVLAYGRTWTRAGLTCSSATTGLRCTNRDGHGFFLSRQSWARF